ncbi:hypothetical protein PV326_011033 [Microctonus aethiopoides]|nr:hypothetical protein PV326_011033 [Microctonus aethiopoides]
MVTGKPSFQTPQIIRPIRSIGITPTCPHPPKLHIALILPQPLPTTTIARTSPHKLHKHANCKIVLIFRWSRRRRHGMPGGTARDVIDYRTGYIKSHLRSPSGRVR